MIRLFVEDTNWEKQSWSMYKIIKETGRVVERRRRTGERIQVPGNKERVCRDH